MQPHKCPVCDGRGTVPNGFYTQPMSHQYHPTSTVSMTETCKSCNGTGILWGFSYEPTPNYTPWADPGGTTILPYEIICGGSDNIPPNFNDKPFDYTIINMR